MQKKKKQVQIENWAKKVTKNHLQETISLLSLPANSDTLTHMPGEVRQEVMFAFLQ